MSAQKEADDITYLTTDVGHHDKHHDDNKKYTKRRLLLWSEMPPHLQFNPHIRSGYRPLLSARDCVKSLFYVHNETFNIISHGIPILYILFTVPKILPMSSKFEQRFLIWCHIAGTLSPWIGSFLYHLFMNLRTGATFYYFLLQLDMIGIWIAQSFGALPMIFVSSYCLPSFVKNTIITLYSCLSVWGLFQAMTAWTPWERRLCFLLPFIMRICMWFLRLSSYGGGDPDAFVHLLLQDIVSIVGVIIGALRIPEKWFPGSCDMYLNSHNIMHILVVIAVYHMHCSTTSDLIWMSNSKCL